MLKIKTNVEVVMKKMKMVTLLSGEVAEKKRALLLITEKRMKR